MRSSNVAASATNEASFLVSREYQPKPETSRTRRCSARTSDAPGAATSFTRSSTAWLWLKSSIGTRILANIAPHLAFVSLCQPSGIPSIMSRHCGRTIARAVWIPLGFRRLESGSADEFECRAVAEPAAHDAGHTALDELPDSGGGLGVHDDVADLPGTRDLRDHPPGAAGRGDLAVDAAASPLQLGDGIAHDLQLLLSLAAGRHQPGGGQPEGGAVHPEDRQHGDRLPGGEPLGPADGPPAQRAAAGGGAHP